MGIKIISFARCHTWWANDKSCSNLTDSMHIKLFYWNSNLLKRLQNRKLKTVNNRNSGLKRVHSFRFYLKNSIQTTLFDIRWKNREEREERERREKGKSLFFDNFERDKEPSFRALSMRNQTWIDWNRRDGRDETFYHSRDWYFKKHFLDVQDEKLECHFSSWLQSLLRR